MLQVGLDTTQHVESVWEVPPGAGMLPQLVPGILVGVFIDHCCVADGVDVTRRVISATWELYSEDEGVEF